MQDRIEKEECCLEMYPWVRTIEHNGSQHVHCAWCVWAANEGDAGARALCCNMQSRALLSSVTGHIEAEYCLQ